MLSIFLLFTIFLCTQVLWYTLYIINGRSLSQPFWSQWFHSYVKFYMFSYYWIAPAPWRWLSCRPLGSGIPPAWLRVCQAVDWGDCSPAAVAWLLLHSFWLASCWGRLQYMTGPQLLPSRKGFLLFESILFKPSDKYKPRRLQVHINNIICLKFKLLY